MYAISHGKDKLKDISREIFLKTKTMKRLLEERGLHVDSNKHFFDTFSINCYGEVNNIYKCLSINNYVARVNNNTISISINESITNQDCVEILKIFYYLRKILN